MEEAIRHRAINQGQIAQSFEKDFAGYLGAAGAVATNSGTSALVLALRTLGVGRGDHVTIPSYTCLAVLHAVCQIGAKPILADNACIPQRMDYNITAEAVKRVLSRKTKAVIVPHMFGVPAPTKDLLEIGVPLIEDITLSLGAQGGNKPIGESGMLSVCSFHASKMMTCGEGGMLTAATTELYERARYLNGWEADQVPMRYSAGDPPVYELRYNFHMSDIAAALGKSQLLRLPRFAERRRELARQYNERLGHFDFLIAPAVDEEPNVFFRYLMFIKDIDLIQILRSFAAVGIEAGRGVYPPLHRFLRKEPRSFAGAEKAMKAVLSIPLYPALVAKEVDYILSRAEEIFSTLGDS
jgi:perosamine synthetase